MDLQLGGRVALVTGSSKGVGAGIAHCLAREGAIVGIHGRDSAKAEVVAQSIRDRGGQAHVVTGDLTVDQEVERLVARAQSLAGPIDILVNNAGGSQGAEDWTTTRPSTWSEAFDRNTLAAVRTITRVLPSMRERRWGRVVNISSLAAWMPPAARPDYSAVKVAMVAMGASLAKAVANEGITINTVSPGAIRSERLEATFRQSVTDHGLAYDAPWTEVEAKALPHFATVPMNRVGTLDEIGDAVCFLPSPKAAYITGTDLRIDGGAWPGL